MELKGSGYGCYIGNVFTGAMAYADDIVLLPPSVNGMKQMLNICHRFSVDFDITFNPSKSKMLCYNVGQYSPDLHMFGLSIPVVKTEQHLGCHVGTDCNPKRIDRLIGDIYCNCNALLTNFGMLNSDIKYSMFKTFCLPLYGSTLIDYDDKKI